MTILTSKLHLIFAPLAIAITPHLYSANGSQSAPEFSRANDSVSAPAKLNAPNILVDPSSKAYPPAPGAAAGGPFAPQPNLFGWSYQSRALPTREVAKQAPSGGSYAESAANRIARYDLEARDAIEHGNLLAPHYVAVRDIGKRIQLRVIGAPLPPIMGESAGGQSQVRLPILSLAW
jgi:hypothetical protein